ADRRAAHRARRGGEGVMLGFKRKTDGMPDLGQGRGWSESSWRRAPKKQIPVDRLTSTNKGGYLSMRRAEEYVRATHVGRIYVVERGGDYYVADCHHHVVAAMLRGEKTITAHVERRGDR